MLVPLPNVVVELPLTLSAVVVTPVKDAFTPTRLLAKILVDVLFVLVLLNSVIFAKVVDDVKMFCPEKVLLFARSVVDAPVSAVLQPKVPLLYESAVAQVASPAPKKLVV